MTESRADESDLEQWVQEYSNDPEFIAEGLAVDVTDEALEILTERGLTQTWLAKAMGVSRQSVSRMFSATPNLTLLSIARISVALNVRPKILLDSGRYFVQSIHSPFDYEAYRTEMRIQQEQYAGASALDTTVEYPIGESKDAVA